jgi:phage I-like protein
MRIALTELEMTLLAGFNIWRYINDDINKEKLKEVVSILINTTKKDDPLYNLLLIAEAILNNTLIKHITDILLMDEEPNSANYRTATKLIIDHSQNPYGDKALLKALYTQLISLSAYQTNSNEDEVLEAMENIEVIQERLYQA